MNHRGNFFNHTPLQIWYNIHKFTMWGVSMNTKNDISPRTKISMFLFFLFSILWIVFAANSETILTYTFLILSFGSLVSAFFFNKVDTDSLQNSTQKTIENLLKENEFSNDKLFISEDTNNSICLDQTHEKIAVTYRSNVNEKYTYMEFKFSEIISSQLKENEITITQTSRVSQLGGALVGSMVAGSVGAIIGGMGGSSSSEQEVKKIELQIVVNDLLSPIHTINFMDSPLPLSKDNKKYEYYFSEANSWHKTMSVIIKRQEQLNNQVSI